MHITVPHHTTRAEARRKIEERLNNLEGQYGHYASDIDKTWEGDRLTFAGDAVFQVGFEHPDWYNGFEHDPEEAARVRVRLLRELAANRESLVATHLSFPSVCHVAVDGDVFRWVPGPWEY